MNKLIAINMVLDELEITSNKFEAFHSAHEGYGVLLEEVDELWDSIKLNEKYNPFRNRMIKEEAIHVAAMALRMLIDCVKDVE